MLHHLDTGKKIFSGSETLFLFFFHSLPLFACFLFLFIFLRTEIGQNYMAVYITPHYDKAKLKKHINRWLI
jgi:hypothetical protein